MRVKTWLCFILSLVLFSGCSTMQTRKECACKGAMAGAVIGAGSGAVIGHQGDTENKYEGSIIGAAAGAAIGAVVGYMICSDEDQDQDGVSDSKDNCPGTPSGVAVDSFGCPLDSDKDGVLDYLDKCPGTQEGIKVDKNGCPIPVDNDTDKDGVSNSKDKCPDTPKGVKVDDSGCPLDKDADSVPDYKDTCPYTPEGAKVDIKGCSVPGYPLVLGVTFDFNSSKIKEDMKPLIDRAVRVLKENPTIHVRVEGYTDSIGSSTYNLALSERRAQTVKDYLLSHSIASSRIHKKGEGETNPIASNMTEQGRQKNRRVVFIVISN